MKRFSPTQTHENLSTFDTVKMGSERSFGLVFAGVFGLIGFLPVLLGHGPAKPLAVIVATVFLVPALLWPAVLRPLNVLWFRFGLLLHRVMSPVIMGILFYGVLTPVAVLMRLSGKDPLRLKRHPEAKTYWIFRNPPGPTPESMADPY